MVSVYSSDLLSRNSNGNTFLQAIPLFMVHISECRIDLSCGGGQHTSPCLHRIPELANEDDAHWWQYTVLRAFIDSSIAYRRYTLSTEDVCRIGHTSIPNSKYDAMLSNWSPWSEDIHVYKEALAMRNSKNYPILEERKQPVTKQKVTFIPTLHHPSCPRWRRRPTISLRMHLRPKACLPIIASCLPRLQLRLVPSALVAWVLEQRGKTLWEVVTNKHLGSWWITSIAKEATSLIRALLKSSTYVQQTVC